MIEPLSPLARYNESAGNEASTGGALDGLLGEPDTETTGDVKPRRLVKRKPQPKLDEQLLTGPRGLPSLEKHFERVKFKGKGHEVGDLNILMVEMEHWLNRLYPKLTMREMITKMEKMGKKQKVKTCVSKIRLDMPILPEDFVGAEDIVDDVLRGNDEEDEGDDEDDVRRGDEEEMTDTVEQVTSSQSQTNTTLTEEQKKRIEDKKREALERKAAKRARPGDGGGDMNGLSQEEADSVLPDLTLAQTEEKMMQEIDDMESKLSGGTQKDLHNHTQKMEPNTQSNMVESSLTNDEMDEIERELMG
ncbi:putative TIMELESS-interacting protein [Apostichopus japonicus]|uniref:TIMELESS-interacting protein n=1 Tax=Stichopus japonicus TaxID=307972 RepID=A0A2G8JHR9_STIJA|nr:putative TIMELESS-interacting protein [Apostichopus japonicus]